MFFKTYNLFILLLIYLRRYVIFINEVFFSLKRFLIYIFVFVFSLGTIPPISASSVYTYTDGYTKIGEVSIPFAEYMPGTYFTKNGLPCTCHDNVSVNCVASGANCNCLRFVNVDGKSLDLLAVQCIGFARYCFYRLFGFTDHDMNASLFYNAGTLGYGQVTASSVKTLVNSLKPGAHIRFKLAYSEHSVILLSQNSLGFTVYQCNSGGNGIPQASCVVSTKTYTWDSFASYAYRGVVFAHMPNNYPSVLEYSDTPFVQNTYRTGSYTTTDNLRLRTGNGTSYEYLDTIPFGTTVSVTEVIGKWGKTSYKGKEGWICLDYATYIPVSIPLKPKEDSGIYIKDCFIYGVNTNTLGKSFLEMFENADLELSCNTEKRVGTGTVVSFIQNGNTVYSATVVINGDTNGDGLVTSADFTNIKAHLSGGTVLEGAFALAADVNENGAISTADYKLIALNLSKSA